MRQTRDVALPPELDRFANNLMHTERRVSARKPVDPEELILVIASLTDRLVGA